MTCATMSKGMIYLCLTASLPVVLAQLLYAER